MNTAMCPNCETELNVQKTHENYTLHKTKLLSTGANSKDDEQFSRRRFKNQKCAERRRRG